MPANREDQTRNDNTDQTHSRSNPQKRNRYLRQLINGQPMADMEDDDDAGSDGGGGGGDDDDGADREVSNRILNILVS